jgi:CheY-like chemotaxis protein
MANELILIVEDNPKNLKLVRDTLQVKGYQTIEAETGEEGVRLAHERHPALILMDIQASRSASNNCWLPCARFSTSHEPGCHGS